MGNEGIFSYCWDIRDAEHRIFDESAIRGMLFHEEKSSSEMEPIVVEKEDALHFVQDYCPLSRCLFGA